MKIKKFKIKYYNDAYQLWLNSNGIGLRSIDDSRKGIKKYLKRNKKTSFIVMHNSELIGVILAGHDGRRGYIYHMCVKESYQNQKIGTLLLKTAEQALEKQHITKVSLIAKDDNFVGNKFWEKHNYITRPDLVYRNKSLNNFNQ